jgi:ABC-type polar amino acid transport system ATPase subunit
MVELAEEGMTMIVVTHEMGFANELQTRSFLWMQGKLSKQRAQRIFSQTQKR